MSIDTLKIGTLLRVNQADHGPRPAFGRSTPVAIDIRMCVWLETVPALLQRLDVKHVAILTHLAEAIYALNTLFHCRSLLDSKIPYEHSWVCAQLLNYLSSRMRLRAITAPWVSIVYSSATSITIAVKLSTHLLDSYVDLNIFINSKIISSAFWFEEIISSAATLLVFFS